MMKNQKNIMFTGTSIDMGEAEALLGSACNQWQVRPPVRRDDLVALLQSKSTPGVVCIIDGIFFGSDAVAVLEIRDIIDAGWQVYGASSMGALRAVEARPLGMIGLGIVYRWFSRFKVADDDEVTQAIDPQTSAPLSTAMIDLRAFVRHLRKKQLINRAEQAEIVGTVKKCYFPERHLHLVPPLIKDPVSRERAESEMHRFVGPKQRDAEHAIRYLAMQYSKKGHT